MKFTFEAQITVVDLDAAHRPAPPLAKPQPTTAPPTSGSDGIAMMVLLAGVIGIIILVAIFG